MNADICRFGNDEPHIRYASAYCPDCGEHLDDCTCEYCDDCGELMGECICDGKPLYEGDDEN